MDETGFPPGVYHLRDTTVRGRGGKKFFRAAEGFKRETLERLFREFPDRRFVLVGDVYDKDPEIFGAMGRAHLRQIEHIYIWDPNGVNRHTVRYDKAFQGVPPFLWSVAQNAGDMMR
jgi:phosphatidate phosphatase APP1